MDVVQALCLIRGLDMQGFYPFYMSYITSGLSIQSSSLAAVERKAPSFFSNHGGLPPAHRALLTCLPSHSHCPIPGTG